MKRLRKHVDSAFKATGLPGTMPATIPVPIPEMVDVAKSIFARGLRQASLPAEVIQWCISHVRFCRSRFPQFQHSWTHVKDANKLDWDALQTLSPDTMLRALSGKDMALIDKSWDIPRFLSDQQLRSCLTQSLLQAFPKVERCTPFFLPPMKQEALKACAKIEVLQAIGPRVLTNGPFLCPERDQLRNLAEEVLLAHGVSRFADSPRTWP